ncbi:hydroxymethylbilane synthase [Rhodovulum adriaticum]|uniref:Porphobilinogen deaminase n=1 Tax=Rhodovulum adriaticum TaxID=35804 RepID=A0A4R2NK27_RHOAD|nr:hydroxymethylbilane synthase [Rhodovulum adriaticum]MBK1635565.1 hydroxymethylbilane synthase [Rhodovulum adriaticum]TCP21801.1 hydroxymethylbilane synthase [Rhodovulum adriaticum]
MAITLPSPASPLKIGTRGSPLALAQAYQTRSMLMAAFDLPEDAFEIVVIKTIADKVLDRALKEIGGKGLFTKEIEEAMLDGRIDIAVHSTKDMGVEQPEGLVLDTFLPREDFRDAFISHKFEGLAQVAEGAVVGTSSLRRRAQLLNRRPDLKVVEFRGNVQKRMEKLGNGVADATFLAMAGLNRLDMADVARATIEPEEMLPAVAQGAIGIERRTDDAQAAHLMEALHDKQTGEQMAAERAFLAALDGSCETPIGGLAQHEGGNIWLRGEILRPDGSESITGEDRAPIEDAAEMGWALGKKLREQAGEGFFDWIDD